MIGYYVILGVFTLIGWIVSSRLKSKFNHYSKIPNSSGLSGYEVAHVHRCSAFLVNLLRVWVFMTVLVMLLVLVFVFVLSLFLFLALVAR